MICEKEGGRKGWDGDVDGDFQGLRALGYFGEGIREEVVISQGPIHVNHVTSFRVKNDHHT